MAETRAGNPKLPEKLREAGKQVGREDEMKRGRKEGQKGTRQERTERPGGEDASFTGLTTRLCGSGEEMTNVSSHLLSRGASHPYSQVDLVFLSGRDHILLLSLSTSQHNGKHPSDSL